MKRYHSHQYMANKIRNTEPLLAFREKMDYVEWKYRAKNKLEELLGLPFETCEDRFVIIEEKDTENYHQIGFEFQSEEGYFILGDFLMPIGANGKLPVVIGLQGHTTGKHVSLGVHKYDFDTSDCLEHSSFALQAVQEGYCAVIIDQRYMGMAGQNVTGNPGCCTTGQALPTLLLGRTAIGERVWDVMRLLDVLETHFSSYIDEERIICVGNSGGGTTTFYAAALDERIYMAAPSCAVCTFEDSIVDIHHCSCNYVPGIRKYFNMGDIGCLIAPRKLIVTCGIYDDIFPLQGVEESYAVIEMAYRLNGCEKNCCLVKGNGGHQFYPDDVWPILRELLEE